MRAWVKFWIENNVLVRFILSDVDWICWLCHIARCNDSLPRFQSFYNWIQEQTLNMKISWKMVKKSANMRKKIEKFRPHLGFEPATSGTNHLATVRDRIANHLAIYLPKREGDFKVVIDNSQPNTLLFFFTYWHFSLPI